MNTDQIECILRKTFHHDNLHANYLGVYARDKIPLPLKRFPACFIANTDRSGQPGQHWVAFYQASCADRLEFFDSYGLYPELYHFKVADYVHNAKPLQDTDSMVCGQYCILYLIHRSKAPKMHHVVNFLASLGKSYYERDSAVDNLVHRHKFYPQAPSCDPKVSHNQCCVSYRNLNLFP
jgi:hypothetical protein